VEEANRYLGYAYGLSGIVVNGHHIGRKIGFPTANLKTDEGKLLPKDGVYGVFVYLGGVKYKGMLNIGNRPTLENGADKSVEVHILDFEGDIYEKELTVELQHYVRPEKKYRDISELIEQMRKDRDQISHILVL
jgi:riboflavin kinase/FMN adenylyltransferase